MPNESDQERLSNDYSHLKVIHYELTKLYKMRQERNNYLYKENQLLTKTLAQLRRDYNELSVLYDNLKNK